MEKMTSLLRLRMSAKDAHYGGNLVDGAHMVHLFGDVATELLIKCDGDEGLFCAYDNVEFLAPVYAGDYIEAYGEIEKVGNTSRTMKFEARKVIVSRPDISASAADVLEEPLPYIFSICCMAVSRAFFLSEPAGTAADVSFFAAIFVSSSN